jgi:hypothetical protein
MRTLVLLVLLAASGAAWAKSDISVNIRYDDRHGEDRIRNGGDRKHYNQRRHHKTDRARGYRHGERYATNHNRHQRRYSNAHDGKRQYRSRAGRWIRADQFQTRRHHASDPVIHINALIAGLGMTALKRDAHIHEAFVEFGNGAIKPLYELEGGLHRGQQATRYFKKPRYVRRLILRVESARRGKRAYVGVDYLPVRQGKKDRLYQRAPDE